MAGFIGVIVGLTSLRVRHDFLAVTTMGIGFIFLGFVRKQRWLGGELGISGIPDSGISAVAYSLSIAGAAAAVIAFSLWLKRSWMGFTFDAIADDEDAARTVGVNVSAYKLTAFGIGTALAGLAGGLYVYFARIILPDTFDFVQSIAILTMVVIGGTGSVWGVVAATIALTLLPEVPRAASDYRLLFFGSMPIVVMRVSPGGLARLGRSSFSARRPPVVQLQPDRKRDERGRPAADRKPVAHPVQQLASASPRAGCRNPRTTRPCRTDRQVSARPAARPAQTSRSCARHRARSQA